MVEAKHISTAHRGQGMEASSLFAAAHIQNSHYTEWPPTIRSVQRLFDVRNKLISVFHQNWIASRAQRRAFASHSDDFVFFHRLLVGENLVRESLLVGLAVMLRIKRFLQNEHTYRFLFI